MSINSHFCRAVIGGLGTKLTCLSKGLYFAIYFSNPQLIAFSIKFWKPAQLLCHRPWLDVKGHMSMANIMIVNTVDGIQIIYKTKPNKNIIHQNTYSNHSIFVVKSLQLKLLLRHHVVVVKISRGDMNPNVIVFTTSLYSKTLIFGFLESRLASTQPADLAPTMMWS